MLHPNLQRSKSAIIMVWMVMILYIIITILELIEKIFLSEINEVDLSVGNELFYLIIMFFYFTYLVTYIISAVTFIKWFRRAYYNLGQKVGNLRYSDDWAAVGWFVPFMNWFVPYRIMKELYTKTFYLLNMDNRTDSIAYARFDSSKINLWWTLWMITGFIEFISLRVYLRDDTDIAITILTTLSCLLIIPLAFITVRIIREYSDMEAKLVFLEGNNDKGFRANNESENIKL